MAGTSPAMTERGCPLPEVLRDLRPLLAAAVIQRLLFVLRQIVAILLSLPLHPLARSPDLAGPDLEQHVLDRPDVAARKPPVIRSHDPHVGDGVAGDAAG